MARGVKILLTAIIAIILGAQAYFTISLLTPDGLRVSYPETGSPSGLSLVVAGDAWMAPGSKAIERIEVVAEPVAMPGVAAIRTQASLQWVEDRGRPIYPLPFWSAPMTLGAEGEWIVTATAFAAGGRSVSSKAKRFSAAAVPPRAFRAWSVSHIAAICVSAAVIAAIAIAAGKGKESFMRRFIPIYAIAMLGNEITFQFYWFDAGGWSTTTSLMLHMCGIAILLLPAVMMMRPSLFRDRLSEIIYFWGTGGAVQALIFPDVGAHGFPTFRFFAFFISHCLIIAGSFSLVTSGRLRITIGSLGRHYLATNIFMVPIFFIDRLLASVPPYAPGNYFLLGYPPPQGSIVDLFAQVFGPSPWYVIGFEIMGIGVFGILWLPWALARRSAARRPVR